MVIYHGREKWSAGSQFSDILEVKSPKLRKYVPNFHYILYDLVRHPDEKLVGIANLKVMLHLLKHIKSPDFYQKLKQILRLLAQEGLDMSYLSTVTIYVLSTTEIPLESLVKLLNDNVSEEGGNTTMSTLQKLLERERIEGEIKGRTEGRIEGEIKGKIKELLKVLSWIAPELAIKYESEIQVAKTEQDLESIEEKIRQEIKNT